MSLRTQENCVDVDWLSLDYLIAECIWDPNEDEFNECENLHPELPRHPYSGAIERGDFTLRYWRGKFYGRDAGRYIHVSDSDMKALLVRHRKNKPGRLTLMSNALINLNRNRTRSINQQPVFSQ